MRRRRRRGCSPAGPWPKSVTCSSSWSHSIWYSCSPARSRSLSRSKNDRRMTSAIRQHDVAAPVEAKPVFDWLFVLAVLAVIGVYVRAIYFTPLEALQGAAQKIYYIHVPSAI